jgi:signal transduction histidine kinase
MDLHAQILLRDRSMSAEARASAAHIRSDARQLSRMIFNLLDISKADEGKLEPKVASVDLSALVGTVFEDLQALGGARSVTLRSSADLPRVRADEELLRRTVANLVENAIRHAPAGTEVAVSASVRDGQVELRVRDSGRGIPPELRDKIFDPFVQLSGGDASLGRGGRGLGLTFCRLAVEAHGGRIWVEDAAPGAAFCVRLPHGD